MNDRWAPHSSFFKVVRLALYEPDGLYGKHGVYCCVSFGVQYLRHNRNYPPPTAPRKLLNTAAIAALSSQTKMNGLNPNAMRSSKSVGDAMGSRAWASISSPWCRAKALPTSMASYTRSRPEVSWALPGNRSPTKPARWRRRSFGITGWRTKAEARYVRLSAPKKTSFHQWHATSYGEPSAHQHLAFHNHGFQLVTRRLLRVVAMLAHSAPAHADADACVVRLAYNEI